MLNPVNDITSSSANSLVTKSKQSIYKNLFISYVKPVLSFAGRNKFSISLVIGAGALTYAIYRINSRKPIPKPIEETFTDQIDWVRKAPNKTHQNGREKVRRMFEQRQPTIQIHGRDYTMAPLLDSFPPNLEEGSSFIKIIDFIHCEIKVIPPEIKHLSLLEEINLHDNLITQIPPEIGELSALVVLDLSRNRLENLPAELAQLTNLRVLSLSFNQFKGTFPEEIFTAEWKKLESLEIGNWLDLPPVLANQLHQKAKIGSRFAQLFCDANELPYVELT